MSPASRLGTPTEPIDPLRTDLDASASVETTDGASAPASLAGTRLTISVEPAYTPGHRPKPSGEVAAAGDDEFVARWNLGGNGDPSYVPNQPSFHPGTRVVVDTHVVYPKLPSGAAGTKAKGLTARRVLAQARSRGYWPFRVCYEAGLAENSELAGETRLRFTIGPRGGILAARLLKTELRTKSVAACVVKRVRALRFDPAPGRKVDVDLSVEFWPGDAPLSIEAAPGPSMDAATERSIVAALTSQQPQIEACYAAGVARDAALWGRVALQCEVGAEAKAVTIEERESRFPDSSVVDCLKSVFSELVFPASARGKTVVVAIRLGQPPASGDAGAPQTQSD